MKSKRKKIMQTLAVLLGTVVIIAVGLSMGVRLHGKYSLQKDIKKNEESQTEAEYDTEAYDLSYLGKQYRWREDIVNILCIGVDKEEIMSERDDDGDTLGQADAIFLVSIDMKEKQIRVIAIPRDSMVELHMYSEMGEYFGDVEGQLALQYAYADGGEKSCLLMKERVGEILCGVPIHGYAAINLSCIPVINDAVGGVEITMEEDYTLFNPAFRKGATVVLQGEQAQNFVQGRDTTEAGSAYNRIGRQKQYLSAFVGQAKKALGEDVMLPVTLMKELKVNMMTDLTVDEVLYLATEAADCDFSEESMYILPGEIKMGERYEEYYLDANAAAELAADLFCEEI